MENSPQLVLNSSALLVQYPRLDENKTDTNSTQKPDDTKGLLGSWTLIIVLGAVLAVIVIGMIMYLLCFRGDDSDTGGQARKSRKSKRQLQFADSIKQVNTNNPPPAKSSSKMAQDQSLPPHKSAVKFNQISESPLPISEDPTTVPQASDTVTSQKSAKSVKFAAVKSSPIAPQSPEASQDKELPKSRSAKKI